MFHPRLCQPQTPGRSCRKNRHDKKQVKNQINNRKIQNFSTDLSAAIGDNCLWRRGTPAQIAEKTSVFSNNKLTNNAFNRSKKPFTMHEFLADAKGPRNENPAFPSPSSHHRPNHGPLPFACRGPVARCCVAGAPQSVLNSPVSPLVSPVAHFLGTGFFSLRIKELSTLPRAFPQACSSQLGTNRGHFPARRIVTAGQPAVAKSLHKVIASCEN